MIGAAAFWYFLLCWTHYFNQRPLWNDEECVFNSVRQLTGMRMFREELLNLQVFPRVYLFLIQTISRPFDFHLLSLRLIPFIAMTGAFLIWLRLAAYELKNRWDYLTFVLSWAGSALMIYYAAELKPYSMDVLTAAVFLFFLYHQERWERSENSRRYEGFLIFLPLLGLLSYTAFLFTIFPLYNLIFGRREGSAVSSGRRLRYVLIYTASLAAALLFSYLCDIRLRPVGAVTEGFADYFISFSSVGDFFKTLGEGLTNLFSRWFAERPRIIKKTAIFFVSLGLIRLFTGFFTNFKKDGFTFRSVNTIALILFAELFVLASLKKYPLGVPRTVLFYCPIVLYLTVRGIRDLQVIHRWIYRAVNGLYWAFLIAVSAGLARLVFSGDLGGIPKLW